MSQHRAFRHTVVPPVYCRKAKSSGTSSGLRTASGSRCAGRYEMKWHLAEVFRHQTLDVFYNEIDYRAFSVDS